MDSEVKVVIGIILFSICTSLGVCLLSMDHDLKMTEAGYHWVPTIQGHWEKNKGE